jgi:hypothetical protein
MLKIRESQLEVFSRLDAETFEEWVFAHLHQFFPRRCAALGKPRLYRLIRSGIESANRYNITAKADVCKYIDLMLVLGPDFEKDSRYPWAADILKQKTSPRVRMRELLGAARKHLR